MTTDASKQRTRTRRATRLVERGNDLPQRFKRVYFHLYSNSNTSRAETLLADLSLLLLVKLLAEADDGIKLESFLRGKSSANKLLLPALHKAYPHLIDAMDGFHLGDISLRDALRELEDVRLSASAAHVLGEAFQALIGPRIRGDKGQFFTPRSLVRAMVRIVAPRPGERVLDPACGTGGFLYEALAEQQEQGGPPLILHGADKDRHLACFAAALLAYRTRASVIANLNSLRREEREQAGICGPYDVILTNPPFGTKIPIRDEAILQEFDLGYEWHWSAEAKRYEKTEQSLASQDPQILFLELCIRLLKPGGRLGIVLPEGVFGNKQDAHIWDFVRAQGEIIGLLDCPRTTFQPGTDTKTNVLFFRKSPANAKPRETLKQPAATAVAVALQCGHDRRGHSQRIDGTPFPDDFADIGRGLSYRGRTLGEPWKRVAITNPYYLVPRYYIDEPPASAFEKSLLAGARYCSLGELRSDGIIDIRSGHEVGSEAYGSGDVPFVRTSDIANFEVSSDPTKSVSEEIYVEHAAQQRLKAGSIIMVVDGRYRIGATAILTRRSCRCLVQSHFRIIDSNDPSRLEPYGLLFALNLPSVRRRIRDLVFIQSTLGTLGNRLLELRIPILHGDGPRRETVARFKASLAERDALLGTLSELVAPEIDL